MRSSVYFARFANQTIKIGISRNLTDRLRTLEREAGVRGSFIGRLDVTEREAPILERAIHRALGQFWLRGEWFSDCQEVRTEIRRLLRDPMAIQAILDRVRGAERDARRSKGPRPNVRVIARIAGDIMSARGPECPDMIIEDAVTTACAAYRIPTDEAATAKAIRVARARILTLARGETATTTDAPTPIAAVLHGLLNASRFADPGELAEALKWRCARLGIPYDGGRISDAIRLVGYTRPLIAAPPTPARRAHHERPDTAIPITRAEAADLWPRLVAAALKYRPWRPA